MINYSKFIENSRKWLSQYIKDNHLQSLVVGISGGIDSCISACLAQPVCQELNIPLIGRSLPTGTNKQCECDVADLVGNAFCNEYKVVALDRPYLEMFYKLEQSEGNMTNLQKGNIKARLRMIYLRHLASIHKGVVLDNDNFTEWNLGFYTVGGDQFDINLGLHYLWKTEIYELANYLANEVADEDNSKFYALKESMNLIPTDGNGVSNSDCEQFGLDNYEQVDDVLKTMYYSGKLIKDSDKLILKAKQRNHFIKENSYHITYEDGTPVTNEYIRLIDSYNEQGVDKVMILHQNTEYKRKELPIKPTKEELGL